MITCPNCGRENADNFNFCLDCGYDLKSYRESMGNEAGAPPVGEAPEAPAPGRLSSGSPTESMDAGDVESAAASASNPGTQPASDLPAPPPAGTGTAPAQPAAEPPAPAPAPASSTPAPAPASSTPAPAGATCPSCGQANPPGMKFCGNCGSPMDGSARPQPAPAAPEGGAGRTMFMHAADVTNIQREKTCKLVTIDQSGQEGMTFSLKKGETQCGRVNGVILFFDDPYVSPTHCLFDFKGDSLEVTDAGSLNGVYLRIKGEHALSEGDHLRIGRQLFRYEALAAAKDQVQRAEGDDAKIWGSPNPGAFGRLLQILEDGRTGEIRLLSGEACNLGREQGDIVFPTDGFISGRHCSFFLKDGATQVKDLGSSNGTYLRIRGTAAVSHGDFLLVGNQMLRVEIV